MTSTAYPGSPADAVDSTSPVDAAAAAAVLGERLGVEPRILLVLGSGLGGLADAVESPVAVPFGAVPGLPASGVAGHAGQWVGGLLEGRPVLVQSGRFHFYEGHDAAVVTAPVRIAAALGIRTLILTNAAGGIHRTLEPGSLMLVEDHVNLLWKSPLAGPVHPGDERFPDMSAPYDPELQALAMDAALELGIPLARGVYCALLGPSYETPAEIRMLARLGVDAVGMSTVPEVVAARAAGLRVLAFSMITNRAAGLAGETLSHEDVMAVGRSAGMGLERILRRVLSRMP